jgi:hypothetical protein
VWDRLGRGESRAAGRLDLARELDALAAMIQVAGGSAVLPPHPSQRCCHTPAKEVPGAMHVWEPGPMAALLATFTTRCAAR